MTPTTTTCPVPDTSIGAPDSGNLPPSPEPARACGFRVRVWPDPRARRQQQAAWDTAARARQAHGETAPGRSASSVTERPQPDRAVDDVARQVGLGSGRTRDGPDSCPTGPDQRIANPTPRS